MFRKHLSLSEKEWYGLLVAALFLGFMFSFRKWGEGTPDISAGLMAMAVASLLSLLAVATHLFSQKISGLYMGYTVKWSVEIPSLIVSLVLCFITAGYLVLPLYGSIQMDPVQELRFGRRPGFRFYHLGWTAVVGSVTNLVFALVLRLIWNFIHLALVQDLAIINLMIAIAMSLPVPTADGLHLFFASRTDYVAFFSTVLIFSLLLSTQLSVLWLLMITGLFALCAWIGYWLIEKNIR